jgi:hypothetical protein
MTDTSNSRFTLQKENDMSNKDVTDRVVEERLPIEGLSEAEDAGLMYDPSTQAIDLSKDEKRRTTALFMAINAYREMIIKEADYLREASDLARRGEGPKIQPASMDAIVVAAIKFDAFIAGKLTAEYEIEPEPDAEPEG